MNETDILNAKILIIDDAEANLKLLEELLKVEPSLILEEVKTKNSLHPSTFMSFSFRNSIYSFRLILGDKKRI